MPAVSQTLVVHIMFAFTPLNPCWKRLNGHCDRHLVLVRWSATGPSLTSTSLLQARVFELRQLFVDSKMETETLGTHRKQSNDCDLRYSHTEGRVLPVCHQLLTCTGHETGSLSSGIDSMSQVRHAPSVSISVEALVIRHWRPFCDTMNDM